ncbi:MAG: SDR family NAD(P)-dependent oxidoreductase, partial [Gemmatimonadota bacterium]
MRRVLITGANRGLGLAFTKVALARGDSVYAACRSPDNAADLHTLEPTVRGRLDIVRLDLARPAEFADVRRALEAKGEWLDLLVNNAGIYIRSAEVEPEASHLSIRSMRAESTLRMFEINTVAPMVLTRELLPRIRPREGSIIAFLSSGMASIGRKAGAEVEFSYSASKAALNMLVRVLAHELRPDRIAVTALNPGWVATDMGTPAAPLQPDQVAAS